MRDYSNSGLISPNGVRIIGHHNIVQMETRNEKKDRFEIMEQPQVSQGEVATGQEQDLATKYSTIYEKPYMIPFSNVSPQIPERAVGIKLGEGTAVSENIRPLTTTYVNPMRNEPSKTDKIDVPTGVQDFTRSYEKTPIPDTVSPTTPYPTPFEPPPFEADVLFPGQTAEEYQRSEINKSAEKKSKKDDRLGLSIRYNEKTKRQELRNRTGEFIRNLNMRTREDKDLYLEIMKVPYEPPTKVERNRAVPAPAPSVPAPAPAQGQETETQQPPSLFQRVVKDIIKK
jgi:hypothetical protein